VLCCEMLNEQVVQGALVLGIAVCVGTYIAVLQHDVSRQLAWYDDEQGRCMYTYCKVIQSYECV
jgi:hypothetical protein